MQELRELLLAPDVDAHHAFPVSFILLADAQLPLAQALVLEPRATLELLEEALGHAQMARLGQMETSGDATERAAAAAAAVFKELAHVRMHGFPWDMAGPAAAAAAGGRGGGREPHVRRPAVNAVGSHHLNMLITISGTMVRAGAVKMLEYKKVWGASRCSSMRRWGRSSASRMSRTRRGPPPLEHQSTGRASLPEGYPLVVTDD